MKINVFLDAQKANPIKLEAKRRSLRVSFSEFSNRGPNKPSSLYVNSFYFSLVFAQAITWRDYLFCSLHFLLSARNSEGLIPVTSLNLRAK